ncbi:MAG: methionyl-tRNA formyltransferase [Gammaproteobacteria bacterium]|nr:methionyl-tRNA formyltransferase [Gammaproteobacteria bacterium]
MKILYAGSSFSSSEILRALITSGFNITGVISQPDKRSKRGSLTAPSFVSAEALKNNISIYRPSNLGGEFQKEISKLTYDILLVVAYGKILPEWLINSPKISPLNIHFSLLPKYRGASPIQSAILNNEKITGISIMKMTTGLDEGPVYISHNQEIFQTDNRKSLEDKLTSLCIKNINRDLEKILNNQLEPINQDIDNISYCSKINKSSGCVHFINEKAEDIFNKFRAYFGWPGLYFERNNLKIKIHGIAKNPHDIDMKENGDFYFYNNELIVKTIDGTIVITHLQFPGKGIITSKDAANSYSEFFKN